MEPTRPVRIEKTPSTRPPGRMRSSIPWSLLTVIGGGVVLIGGFLWWDWDTRRHTDIRGFGASQAAMVDPSTSLPSSDDEQASETTTTSAEIDPAPAPDWSAFTVSFDVGGQIGADGAHTVQRLADALHANPRAEIKLEGYTDSAGPEDLNRQVGLLRARTVRELLMDHGIESNRIHVFGVGEDFPVATNATAEGRAKNRRVEVSMFPTE